MHNTRYYIWYLVILSALIGSFYAAAFPQFSMTLTQLSILSGISPQVLLISDSIKSAFIVIGMLVSGVVYRALGLKRTFAMATFAFLIPQVLLPSVNTVSLLFILKAIQGLSSIMYSVFLTLILKYASTRQTGLSSALFNGIFFGASGVITGLTGFIIHRKGWIVSYHVLSFMVLFLSLLWFFTVRDREAQDQTKELGASSSVRAIFGSSRLWLLAIGLISTVWTNQTLLVDGPLYAKALGFSDLETGKIMSVTTLGILLACLFSGRFSDLSAASSRDASSARIKVFMIGPLVIVLSVGALLLVKTSQVALFSWIILAVSFGSAWGFGSFYCILPEIYRDGEIPLVTGMAGGMADIAMPVAPLVVGVIFGMRGLWGLGWASCILMACISLVSGGILLKRQRSMKPQDPLLSLS